MMVYRKPVSRSMRVCFGAQSCREIGSNFLMYTIMCVSFTMLTDWCVHIPCVVRLVGPVDVASPGPPLPR